MAGIGLHRVTVRVDRSRLAALVTALDAFADALRLSERMFGGGLALFALTLSLLTYDTQLAALPASLALAWFGVGALLHRTTVKRARFVREVLKSATMATREAA